MERSVEMEEKGKSFQSKPIYESPKLLSLDAKGDLFGGDVGDTCDPTGSNAGNNCYTGNNPDYGCNVGNSAGTLCFDGNDPFWVGDCQDGSTPE